MHPAFREAMLKENRRELDRHLRQTQLLRRPDPVTVAAVEPVVLRLSRVQDEIALDTLGRLEGRPVRDGCYVVAEIGGKVVAALPLGGGAAFADPFRPTAHVLPLLALRAKQLDYRPRRVRLLRAAVRAFSRA